MSTLYRQYRPARFADVVGQPQVTEPLQRAFETDRLAHAYLFYGPRGVGKTSLARIMARRFNCTKATEAEACGKCDLCQVTQEGQNIDIIEIDAASNRGIDDIRALQEGIASAPVMGGKKVYIIDEVHMLTREAFTALLKTLEEPVAHAVFILATTEFHKVPETILSRCQVYRFRRATTEEMTGRLSYILEQEKRTVSQDALNFIVGRSDGCYRDAESLLGQALTLTDGDIELTALTEFLGLPPAEQIESLLSALVRADAKNAVALLDTIFAEGYDPEQLVQELIRAARDEAVQLASGKGATTSFGKEANAVQRLPEIIRAFIQATNDFAFVPQPLIALHLAVLTVCAGRAPVAVAPQVTEKKAVQPVAPAAKKPLPVATPVQPEASAPTGSVTPEAIREAWPKVIETVRLANPVAATFLRAMEPSKVVNSTVVVTARYALHRNFFEKSENRAPIEAALSQVVGQELTIRCIFDDSTQPKAPTSVREQEQQESNLVSAAKELFG